ncbi:MAG: SHOCT domain-containing protein [Deltaproteobacteria bacterium]
MMNWYGNYPFMHGFGGIFMILFWLLLIVIVFYLVKKSLSVSGGKEETAEDILKKRYARGEISKEEFERIKKDLRT